MARARTPLGTALEASLSRRCAGPVAGIDEAGRGPWAGPVVAAAVVLGPGAPDVGIQDSKRLTARAREAALEILSGAARIGIGRAEVAEIEALGIVGATDLAMTRAVGELAGRCEVAGLLVDGRRVPPALARVHAAEAVIGGDGIAASIAAASIVAKVARDRLMDDLARRHPGYGWERNRGYGTAEHRAALARLGVTPEHRRSFRPIHNILCEESRIDS